MAEPGTPRTAPLNPLPNDEEFTPGREPDSEVHPPEDSFWDNVWYEDNAYKVEHYRALGQYLANEWNCSVKLHYSVLPGYQRTGPTMRADFIPADEAAAGGPGRETSPSL